MQIISNLMDLNLDLQWKMRVELILNFLLEMCKEMNKRGIERISIPDTVGIMRPRGMYNLVKLVYDNIDNSKTSLDVHCHNDVGLALSNALSGCDAGADQIHTTIDGLGERTGIPIISRNCCCIDAFI